MEETLVVWEGTAHEVLLYNEDNGHGLTRCEKRIGPQDAFDSGTVTCRECLRKVAAGNVPEGPREWFPEKTKLDQEKVEMPAHECKQADRASHAANDRGDLLSIPYWDACAWSASLQPGWYVSVQGEYRARVWFCPFCGEELPGGAKC